MRIALGAPFVPLFVAMAISLDGSTACGQIRLTPPTGAAELLVAPDRVAACCLAFSDDGNLLAVGKANGTIQLWDLRVWRDRPAEEREDDELRVLEDDALEIFSVAISPGGNVLASSSDDNRIRLWNLETNEIIERIDLLAHRTLALAFSPSGDVLASGGGVFARLGEVLFWDPTSGAARGEPIELKHMVSDIAFSSSGGRLLIGGGAFLGPGELGRWNVADGEALEAVSERCGQIDTLATSPDESVVATAGYDMHIRLWSIESGELLDMWPGHTREITFLAFGPEGRMLVSAARDNTVRFWDLEDGGHEGVIYDPYGQRNDGQLMALALSPDGKMLAIGRLDGAITLWDLKHTIGGRPTPLYPYYEHQTPVAPVQIAPPPRPDHAMRDRR